MKSDRRSRQARALSIGIGASVAIHAALFAVLRFDATPFEKPVKPTVTFETPQPIAVVEETPTRPIQDSQPVDATAPEMDEVGESLAGAASSSARDVSRAEATPAEAPLNGEPMLAAADTGAPTLTLATLAVTRPALAVITEAPEAKTTSDEIDEGVPVWTPGSVGKAKRQWAKNGTGAAARGDGDGVGILIGRGGGHCPMPGRGRGRPVLPPSWFD